MNLIEPVKVHGIIVGYKWKLKFRRGRMKNTERIRAMTDEELAHFLATVEAKLYRDDLDIIAYRADEVADALEWLKRESH